MGNTETKLNNNSISASINVPVVSATDTTTAEKKKCKACCACPETKKARDACILENGEENCGKFIEAHQQCMRDMGFKI